ncbi:hypothetical protein D8I30_09710 [Brevundimonas naejangsanensis]|uniref:Uncharacterized protein n=1 Tax=Brevundimonas naejangsanensis TaxID=588932 RepID=A0A494RGF6_9CAUL|nr:hypothetical protein [Brevundimonas naejangsanensis]AYG95421.1 hypothetical protein D8I30_09710 [Brevundimonas naejangsanensis]
MLIELMAVSLLATGADPEGIVSTAPRGGLQAVPAASAASLAEALGDASPAVTLQSAAPHGLTTEEQITRWIGERKAETSPAQPWTDPWEEAEPRRMRGQVSAGIGTGGYRDFAAEVSMPFGESGTLNLSVSQTRNAPWAYPYGYGHGLYGARYGLDGYGWRDAYGSVAGPLGARSPHERPSRIRPFDLDEKTREAPSDDAGR